MPDGDLSKEAEDLLARATIIRDKFILNEQGQVVENDSLLQSANSSPVKQTADPGNGIVEETIAPSSATESHCAPNKPRQNGKLEDSSVSPESVKPEVNSDGSVNPDRNVKDKKKQQQKCCTIM